MAVFSQKTHHLFRQWGRRGGLTRARSLSSSERSAIAGRAARIRWSRNSAAASLDPFDGTRTPTFRSGTEGPLRGNPEQAPVFRPESRRVDYSSVRLSEPAPFDPVYLEEVLSEGSWKDWQKLYRQVADQPFGPTAIALGKVCTSVKIYGVSLLWKGILSWVQGVHS